MPLDFSACEFDRNGNSYYLDCPNGESFDKAILIIVDDESEIFPIILHNLSDLVALIRALSPYEYRWAVFMP